MARRARLHPDAAAEVETARDWYAERSTEAAHAFLSEVDLAIRRVLESPLRWPPIKDEARRYLLPRFPFLLIYRLDRKGDVEVIAVAHGKRRPGYWAHRQSVV